MPGRGGVSAGQTRLRPHGFGETRDTLAEESGMDLGWQELVIILVVVMIVFGAGKLPDVARSLGQGVKAFKDEASSPDGVLGAGPVAATAGAVAVERPARPDDI